MNFKQIAHDFFICIVSLSIPALLLVNTLQSRRYAELLMETQKIEKEQYKIIESNKRLIASISILESPGRIDSLASETLQMQKADPEDIVRVEVTGSKIGG